MLSEHLGDPETGYHNTCGVAGELLQKSTYSWSERMKVLSWQREGEEEEIKGIDDREHSM